MDWVVGCDDCLLILNTALDDRMLGIPTWDLRFGFGLLWMPFRVVNAFRVGAIAGRCTTALERELIGCAVALGSERHQMGDRRVAGRPLQAEHCRQRRHDRTGSTAPRHARVA